MKTVSCLRDLEQVGIFILTGEADRTGYRILCDVSAKGKRTLERAFGVPDFKLADPWNDNTRGEKHVGSILLAPDLALLLGIYGLLEHGCRVVYLPCLTEETKSEKRGWFMFSTTTAYGFDGSSDAACEAEWLEVLKKEGFYARKFSYGEHKDRNQHLMSGRVT